jgi:hypothetical protein
MFVASDKRNWMLFRLKLPELCILRILKTSEIDSMQTNMPRRQNSFHVYPDVGARYMVMQMNVERARRNTRYFFQNSK